MVVLWSGGSPVTDDSPLRFQPHILVGAITKKENRNNSFVRTSNRAIS